MLLDHTSAVPFSATRAEYLAQRKKEHLGDLVRRQTLRGVDKAGALWPGSEEAARAIILRSLEAWQRASPWRPGTREQVALHEGGHFIAFQAVGMIAASAKIEGPPGGRGGWGGEATCWDRPVLEYRGRWPVTAEHVLAEAVSDLAGPAAEHFMGGGDFYSSPGEIIEVSLLARKLAEMKGIDHGQAMVDVLARTIALLDRYDLVIRDVADALVRRKRITCHEKTVEKLLGQVSPLFLTAPWSCDRRRLRELAGLFVQAPIDLPALGRGIVP